MPRPLNFLHLSTFYPPYSFGGDAMQIYRLAHALGDGGHRVDVVHCVDSYHLLHPGPAPAPLPAHPNVHTHELRSGYSWVSPFLTQQTGKPWLKRKAIAALLASRPYDVIHFHNISLLGPEIFSIAASHAVKVCTSHDHWLICPMHVLWKSDGAPCREPQCLRCCIGSHRPPQIWRYTGLMERMASHVDEFFAPSRFTARMHAERGFPRPFSHLPNFVDRVDHEWNDPPPRPHPEPYFLFAGRLEPVKGLQTLIPLWERVLGCDLLIAGTGTYETELRAMAGSNPRIRFLGPQSQDELGALYRHALACVIPSVTYETFGLTSIEAFARKTPVIARDLGGLTEVIEDSGGGFLYRTDEELLAALGRIAGDSEARKHLGQKGYDAFVRSWCREAHLEKYFDCLSRAAFKKFGRVPWSG